MKTCGTCLKEKPLSDFHKRARNKKDGRKSVCKVCTKEYDTDIYKKTDKKAKSNKKWVEKNHDKVLTYSRKSDRKALKLASDSYIKGKICYGSYLTFKDCTPNMIAVVRKILLARRSYADSEGTIYFVKSKTSVKIGFTTNIKNRLRHLKGHNPKKIKLLTTIPGTKETEKTLHKTFSDYLIHGEWFKYTSEVKQFINELK